MDLYHAVRIYKLPFKFNGAKIAYFVGGDEPKFCHAMIILAMNFLEMLFNFLNYKVWTNLSKKLPFVFFAFDAQPHPPQKFYKIVIHKTKAVSLLLRQGVLFKNMFTSKITIKIS